MKHFFIWSFIWFFPWAVAFGEKLFVGSQEKFPTIASALSAAKDGDEVIIRKGIYKEHDLAVRRRIIITGENYPVIDGEGKYEMMDVYVNGVTIRGIRFINSGSANIRDIAALRFIKSRGSIADGNILENNFFGIYLANCSNCTVTRNKITGKFLNEFSSGNGIHNWKSDSMKIIGNTVIGHRDGIYLEFTKHSYIRGNFSTRNVRYGLHFMFSDYNTYIGNHFRNNGSGVAVMYTHDIVMRDNTFDDNWGGAAYGILLKNISHSVITGNRFIRNTVGINMEESGTLYLKNNLFKNNGWAIRIQGSCTEDTLVGNDFIINTFDVSTNSSGNQNFFSGNYWDKYRGYDLNKDGVGDVPYRPVSFFSWLIERVPNSVLLLRSMIADVLDQVERVAPAVIPETLLDDRPEIHPVLSGRKITPLKNPVNNNKTLPMAFNGCLPTPIKLRRVIG